MRIAFYYESGPIHEIGTGHKYRSHEIGGELKKRGHKVEYTSDDIVVEGWDVLVIDHMHSKKSMIERAKSAGIKVVLIDGDNEDALLVNLSISAFVNKNAKHIGNKFLVFPIHNTWNKYKHDTKSKTVFVGMGGFDANNIANFVLGVLDKMNINAIVAKSINHSNLTDKFNRAIIFKEDNYFDAMKECVISITNGGLTFFQSLFYGMPTIPISQYEHQNNNIRFLEHCCVPIKKNEDDLKEKIKWLMESEYYRESLSMLAKYYVDGKGAKRICSLIEEL